MKSTNKRKTACKQPIYHQAQISKLSLCVNGHTLVINDKGEVPEIEVQLGYRVFGDLKTLAASIAHYLRVEGFLKADAKCKVIVPKVTITHIL